MVTATLARESADVRAAGLSQTALVFRVRAATLAVDAERATSRQECALATMVPQAAIVQAKLVQRTAAVTDTAIPARAPVAVRAAGLSQTALVFRVQAMELAADVEIVTPRQECALVTMVLQAATVQAKLVQTTAAARDTATLAREPVAVWVAALATTARAPSIVGRMALVNQANARARLVSLATTAPR